MMFCTRIVTLTLDLDLLRVWVSVYFKRNFLTVSVIWRGRWIGAWWTWSANNVDMGSVNVLCKTGQVFAPCLRLGAIWTLQ